MDDALSILLALAFTVGPWFLVAWLAKIMGPTDTNGTTIDDYILRGGRKNDSNNEV